MITGCMQVRASCASFVMGITHCTKKRHGALEGSTQSKDADVAPSLQERARKLRIFPDEEHPFVGDPRLVPWAPMRRRLRIKEGLFEVPEGFEPLNADAYRKRYGHMLPEAAVQALRQPRDDEAVIPRLCLNRSSSAPADMLLLPPECLELAEGDASWWCRATPFSRLQCRRCGWSVGTSLLGAGPAHA